MSSWVASNVDVFCCCCFLSDRGRRHGEREGKDHRTETAGRNFKHDLSPLSLRTHKQTVTHTHNIPKQHNYVSLYLFPLMYVDPGNIYLMHRIVHEPDTIS